MPARLARKDFGQSILLTLVCQFVHVEGDSPFKTIGNHPFTPVPGFPVVAAKSKQIAELTPSAWAGRNSAETVNGVVLRRLQITRHFWVCALTQTPPELNTMLGSSVCFRSSPNRQPGLKRSPKKSGCASSHEENFSETKRKLS
jgi:hypothetical protein